MDFNTFVTKEANSAKGADLLVMVNREWDGTSAQVTVFDHEGSYICDKFISSSELDALKSDMPLAAFV